MLPLLAILFITAVKDGIEDYRRQQLDDAVNNSAVTRLGDWRNTNLAQSKRGFFARLFGLSASKPAVHRSAKVSKGVRKLREKEGDLNTDFLYTGGAQQSENDLANQSSASLPGLSQPQPPHVSTLAYESQNTLETIRSRDSTNDNYSASTHDAPASVPMGGNRNRSFSFAKSMATSNRSTPRRGVVDYERQTPGTAKWERTLWKKLEVGDVVLLRENDQVPADIVVLSTSDVDGQCFVETKNVGAMVFTSEGTCLHSPRKTSH